MPQLKVQLSSIDRMVCVLKFKCLSFTVSVIQLKRQVNILLILCFTITFHRSNSTWHNAYLT